MSRLDALRTLLRRHEAEALLLTAQPDLRWATGFTGSNGLLLLTRESADFFTDGRYDEQARREVGEAAVHVPGYDLLGAARALARTTASDAVLVSSDAVTVAEFERMRDDVVGRLWPVSALTQALRAVKDDDEVEAIRRAQHLTEAVFSDVIPLLQDGITERDVAAEIVYRHLKGGASRMAFDPIVAFGSNAALPHGRPSDRALQHGDCVLIDMGGMVDGYASDMTRMAFFGTPGAAFSNAYRAVREALAAATEALQAGRTGREVDAAARGLLSEAGYGEAFSHGLGHGVGLDVHEWPRLSHAVEHQLPAGAVVTLEPGVYLAGQFGIRIEDLAVVREGGCEVLTTVPHDLVVVE